MTYKEKTFERETDRWKLSTRLNRDGEIHLDYVTRMSADAFTMMLPSEVRCVWEFAFAVAVRESLDLAIAERERQLNVATDTAAGLEPFDVPGQAMPYTVKA